MSTTFGGKGSDPSIRDPCITQEEKPCFPSRAPILKPNTADFERLPLVKPTGFREYDARWLFPEDINLMGLNAVGLGLAHAGRRARRPEALRRRPRLPLVLGRR